MRYLGGGVGHRATREDVEHSRHTTLRCGPAGGIHPTLRVDPDQDAGDGSGVSSSTGRRGPLEGRGRESGDVGSGEYGSAERRDDVVDEEAEAEGKPESEEDEEDVSGAEPSADDVFEYGGDLDEPNEVEDLDAEETADESGDEVGDVGGQDIWDSDDEDLYTDDYAVVNFNPL